MSMDAYIAGMNVTMSILIADIIPPRRRIKQRMIMCALEKKCIKDMKQKNDKSYALKEAVHLYVQEKAKPDRSSLPISIFMGSSSILAFLIRPPATVGQHQDGTHSLGAYGGAQEERAVVDCTGDVTEGVRLVAKKA